MKSLKPTWEVDGLFELSDSDNHVGSLYTVEDMMTILSIPTENHESFYKEVKRRKLLSDTGRVIEPKLFKKGSYKNKRIERWKILMDSLSSEKPKNKQSLSELELKAVIEKIYGASISIETQSNIGNNVLDIKANYKGTEYYIEFLGPYHFKDDVNIFKDKERKFNLEEKLGVKIIEWPYWIQLCERNVKIAFGENLEGRGAIWGSEILFGESSDAVKQKIISLSENFHAIRKDGIGYFYEEWRDNDGNMIKPAHPIIDKIKGGEETIDILLPMNVNDEGVNFWLPKDLWSL